MADEQRTEQPTQRRRERARREGNFPASREFVSSLQFLGFVAIVASYGGAWLAGLMRFTRATLERATSFNLTAASVIGFARSSVLPQFLPLLAGGGLLVLVVLTAQMATTRFGISAAKLVPDINRLNPLQRLRGMLGQNLPLLAQALVLLPVVGWVVYYEIRENVDLFMALAWMSPRTGTAVVSRTLESLLWRAAALFFLVGCIDLWWQRRRHTRQLRMTKQEVREESKESQGNPQIKMRIRRLQRDLLRRQMMREIPKATAVVVNPTHYAVALRYSLQAGEQSGAPKVIAKGKNYLALRIRQKAIEHQVPIVENPPLAQALYKSAEVGQEIPVHLYRAVAEILAYIHKLMNGRLPG